MIRVIFLLLTIVIAYSLTLLIQYLFKSLNVKFFNLIWTLITLLLLGVIYLNTNLV